MQANKDESEKCLAISKSKYREGDSEGAMKFALKSLKLLKTEKGLDWVKFLKSSTSPAAAASSSSKKPEMRRRTAAETAAEEAEEAPSRPYTQEQVLGIRKILESKKKGDLYGVLGLEKGCSDNDVKKAYRKRALLYHPDKCGAPGTDDAFKAIAHAWTVLGDEDKKANYDRYGIDSESARGGGGGGNPFANAGFGGRGNHFEGEISPEDLLRMFMGGGGFGGPQFVFNSGPGFRTRPQFNQRRNRPGAPDDNNANMTATLMQLLPVLLLFLISTLSFFTTQEDPFSFQKTYEYSMKQSTPRHNVQYYVNPRTYKSRFSTTRQKYDLAQLVDSEYLQQLRMKCSQEKQTQQFYIRQAQSWFSVDKEKLEKARNMAMPNCNQIENWFR